jgi:hypothetical protein
MNKWSPANFARVCEKENEIGKKLFWTVADRSLPERGELGCFCKKEDFLCWKKIKIKKKGRLKLNNSVFRFLYFTVFVNFGLFVFYDCIFQAVFRASSASILSATAALTDPNARPLLSLEISYNCTWILAGLATCLQKTGSETGFLARNLDRLLDRDFQGRISDRKAEQVFKAETGF